MPILEHIFVHAIKEIYKWLKENKDTKTEQPKTLRDKATQKIIKSTILTGPYYVPDEEQDQISARVRAILVDKLGVEAYEVVPEATIQQDLGADSLDMVDLVMDCEREFEVKIPEEDTENIKTVGDIINYIKRHKR